MIIRQGKSDETWEVIKEKKAIAMEDRRRNMEKVSAKKREMRQSHIEQSEKAEAERLHRIKEASALKLRQDERTQRLAEELARRKHIELQESLKTRQAKASSKSANVKLVKCPRSPFPEKKKLYEAVKEPAQSNVWHFTETSNEKLQEKKTNYKRDLQNQLIDNRRKVREMEEEKHRERKIMEEVGETMFQENVKEEKLKKEAIALLQAERDAFLKARQFWKEKRREVLKQEFDEVARTVAKREALQKKEAEMKSDVQAAKDAMVEKLAVKLMEEEQRKIEREEICMELYIAEQENEIARNEMKKAYKKKRTAKELLQDMARHHKAIADKRAKENAIDTAFAKYISDERRKLEEKEREKEQARREKYIQYGNELRETIAKNSVVRAKEIAERKAALPIKEEEKVKIKCYSESTIHKV